MSGVERAGVVANSELGFPLRLCLLASRIEASGTRVIFNELYLRCSNGAAVAKLSHPASLSRNQDIFLILNCVDDVTARGVSPRAMVIASQ